MNYSQNCNATSMWQKHTAMCVGVCIVVFRRGGTAACTGIARTHEKINSCWTTASTGGLRGRNRSRGSIIDVAIEARHVRWRGFIYKTENKRGWRIYPSVLTAVWRTFWWTIAVHSDYDIRWHNQICGGQFVILQTFLLCKKKLLQKCWDVMWSLITSCSVVSDAKPDVSNSGSSVLTGIALLVTKLLLLLLFWFWTTGFFFISLLFATKKKVNLKYNFNVYLIC